MKKTIKVELQIRFVAAIGVGLIIYSTWIQPLGLFSCIAIYIGLILLAFAFASGLGIGPLGSKLKELYVIEDKIDREKYRKAKQPWEE